jgi:PAS domain S-box-containing protein
MEASENMETREAMERLDKMEAPVDVMAGDRQRSDRTSRWSSLLGIAVAMVAALIAASGLREIHQSVRLASLHAQETGLSNLQSSLLDCETGVRGYLLAKDDRLLEPAINCSARARDHLRGLTAKKNIESAVSAVLDNIENTIQAVNAGQRDQRSNIDALLRRKTLMDTARGRVAALRAEVQNDISIAHREDGWLHALQVIGLLLILGYVSWLYRNSRLFVQQLQQRHRLERAIWDNSGDALFLYDVRSGIIVDSNPSAAQLLGVATGAIVGRPWTQFVAPSDIEWARSRVADAEHRTQASVVGHLIAADGQRLPVEAAISSAFTLLGKVLAVSSFRSLSARDQALHEAAFRRAIEDAVPSGLAAVSDKGEQIYVNQRLCDMLGWNRQELIGTSPPFPYWPPEEATHILGLFNDCLEGRIGSGGFEATLMRRSGERFPVHIFVSRIHDSQRPGWMAFIIDLTEKKRLEAALEEIRRLDAVGLLAGQVAHDFNNLLAIIQLHARLAQNAGDNGEEIAQCIATISDAARRGVNITKAMLAIARRQPLNPERIELGEQLQKITTLLTSAAGPHISLKIDVSAAPVWVEVDPGGLTASLLNLVMNAREAMPDGGRLGLRISTNPTAASHPIEAEDKPTCVIEVSDTGIGMTADVKARAFEPFFSTKKEAGVGFGLAMVYGFVRQSSGAVEIDSEPDRGTTVRLVIPTCPPVKSEPAAQPAPSRASIMHKVLVVDDETSLGRALSATLASMGHDVTVAKDAEQALSLLDQQTFDVLLTDILMPGIGGIELARAAAHRYPEMSIILMTGFGMRPKNETLPWPVLEKPFGPQEISALLGKQVSY